MICWPLTSLFLLLRLQSLRPRGSGSSWVRRTMPRRRLNSSPSWTSCWPWTARRWSGKRRPGERQKQTTEQNCNHDNNNVKSTLSASQSFMNTSVLCACVGKWAVLQSTPSRPLSDPDLEYLLCGSRKQEKLPHGTEQGFRSAPGANLD